MLPDPCSGAGMSYRKLEWVGESSIIDTRPALVQAYNRKVVNGTSPVDLTGHDDGMHPEWRIVERVFDERVSNGRTEYYVKWYMLGYAQSTWEDEKDLQSEAVRFRVLSCGRMYRPSDRERSTVMDPRGQCVRLCCKPSTKRSQHRQSSLSLWL